MFAPDSFEDTWVRGDFGDSDALTGRIPSFGSCQKKSVKFFLRIFFHLPILDGGGCCGIRMDLKSEIKPPPQIVKKVDFFYKFLE